MLLDRRHAAVGGALGFLSFPFQQSNQEWNVESCADIICKFTPTTFRQAVQETNHFLYRGSGDSQSGTIKVANPEPDLLISGTYDDEEALDFFFCLERRLGSFPARPSTGHVATSDAQEAGKWGKIISVWPLGTTWAFLWPQDSAVIFPSQVDCQQSKFVLNDQLTLALAGNREVLFSSRFEESKISNYVSIPSKILPFLSSKSAFLSLPSESDDELRRALEKRNYGL